MKPIFPKPQMSHDQKCLLFCLEKEIIDKDLEYSRQNESQDIYEHKCIWFGLWKSTVDSIIKESAGSKELSINSLDKYILHNNLNIKSRTNWKKELYRQCVNFIPYSWKSLRDSGKCDDDPPYERVSPELNINMEVKDYTLKEIATFLITTK